MIGQIIVGIQKKVGSEEETTIKAGQSRLSTSQSGARIITSPSKRVII